METKEESRNQTIKGEDCDEDGRGMRIEHSSETREMDRFEKFEKFQRLRGSRKIWEESAEKFTC